MLELRSLIGKLQSPSFQAVATIAQCAGHGMVVDRHQSIRFPTGTMQIWEFVPRLAPLDRAPYIVAVFIQQGKLDSWIPSEIPEFKGTVEHYTQLSKETWAKAKASQVQDQKTAESASPPESAAVPACPTRSTVAAPPKAVVLPGRTGIRMISDPHGKPLTIGGRPVTFAASGR